jgi:hypothetical protein
MSRLRERFQRDFDALLPAELQALATADLEGSVSNARRQELLTGHPVDISRMLQRLSAERHHSYFHCGFFDAVFRLPIERTGLEINELAAPCTRPGLSRSPRLHACR